MISKIDYIKANKSKWNKKTEILADNKKFKIIGIGPKAFKILWYGPTPGCQATWNQCWWNYEKLDDTIAKTVINKVYKELSKKGGQTTL